MKGLESGQGLCVGGAGGACGRHRGRAAAPRQRRAHRPAARAGVAVHRQTHQGGAPPALAAACLRSAARVDRWLPLVGTKVLRLAEMHCLQLDVRACGVQMPDSVKQLPRHMILPQLRTAGVAGMGDGCAASKAALPVLRHGCPHPAQRGAPLHGASGALCLKASQVQLSSGSLNAGCALCHCVDVVLRQQSSELQATPVRTIIYHLGLFIPASKVGTRGM